MSIDVACQASNDERIEVQLALAELDVRAQFGICSAYAEGGCYGP